MLSPKWSLCPRSNENPVAFVIVRRNETVRRKNNWENWRSSAIRLHRFESLTSGFRFSYEGIIRGRDYYPSEREESKSGGKRSRAFEIHAFIQRGPSNLARREKCYEKWMGQFSISRRPQATHRRDILILCIYTHIFAARTTLVKRTQKFLSSWMFRDVARSSERVGAESESRESCSVIGTSTRESLLFERKMKYITYRSRSIYYERSRERLPTLENLTLSAIRWRDIFFYKIGERFRARVCIFSAAGLCIGVPLMSSTDNFDIL